MAILLSRLSKMRPDIAAFTLTVHEMCADTDPILFGKRTFFEYSADDPLTATAILFAQPEARRDGDFDPLGYVLLAADALKKSPANGINTFSAPMPPYHSGGLLVTRRFECLITYRQPPFQGQRSQEDDPADPADPEAAATNPWDPTAAPASAPSGLRDGSRTSR